MTITAIILAHYKERENNLKRIVDDLLSGTVKPNEIIIFIDNPEIKYQDDRVTIITSTSCYLPIIRFALGSVCDTDYCFFIDDDLTVRSKTLENFINHASPDKLLGLQGSILGDTDTPYANDTSIKRGNKLVEVDIILRTYFVPTRLLVYGLELTAKHPELPKKSLDDIYLSLGNKMLNNGSNFVIPIDKNSDVIELSECGVGQSYSGEHYENRNIVCKKLKEEYA